MNKTNAMRQLDAAKIKYTPCEYEVDENDLSGTHIADCIGLPYEKVFKTTCFLANMSDFAAFNAVYEQYFVSKPARSCVAVKDLPKGVLCEIEALAVK